MEKVESSNIVGLEHNAQAATLDIKFKSGGLYRYKAVKQETVDGFRTAESKGKYYAVMIKGQHECVKLVEVEGKLTEVALASEVKK